jgi:hypothetical protein
MKGVVTMYTRVGSAVAAACAVVVVTAGCGGSSGGGGVAHLGSTTTTPTATASSSDPMAQAIKFATCMRTHGAPDFPDPKTSATGNVLLSVPDTPQSKAAQKTCRRFLAGWGVPPASEEAQRLTSLLEYARCMRTHGVTDFPDPDNRGEFPGTGGFNRSSPNYRAAEKSCLPVARGFVKQRDAGRG